MILQVGQHITHSSFQRPCRIRQIRISKGIQWVGLGEKSVGWIKAEDCQLWKGPKVFGAIA